MNIVILDGYATNPGDLSWKAFEALGTITVHDRTPREEIAARAGNAEIVLTNKTPLSAETIGALPKLRYIGVLATGYNIVDTAAASAHGIVVTNVPGYGTASVAQQTFALILELTNGTGHHARRVAEGAWSKNPDFSFWDQPLRELDGLALGIIGYGTIGRATAKIGRAFGMRILATARRNSPAEAGVTFLPLDDLLPQADVVSLHCPLTPETRGLIGPRALALMKPTALLINTARGPLIDEHAVADALQANRLGGAGLDVLSAEPPPADNPLFAAPRCLITPHQSWATLAARARLFEIAAANLRGFLAGQPVNLVR